MITLSNKEIDLIKKALEEFLTPVEMTEDIADQE